MQELRMPALGADMEQARLVQWRVPSGTHVKPGDVVAVVETHKGAIDVENFLDGVLCDMVPVGTELPVGAVIAHVLAQGEEHPAAVPDMASAPANAEPARPKASPGARRRAQELGIPLDGIHGSAADGAITREDVERASAHPARAAGMPVFDPALMRSAIAAAMSRSKREIPHYYLTQPIDFGAAQDWLAAWNAGRPPAERLLPAVLLLKASARALAQVPQLNGFWRDGAVHLAPAVHLGWAIALRGGGLVAPALRDADRRSLPELMTALRDLVQRARNGGLRSSELEDPTVTVTSMGDRGADSVLGVIYPPQLALIGFGRIASRPWVVQDQLRVRPVVQASLAADHRASDGHVGARLLEVLEAALQQPRQLAGEEP